MKEMVLFSTWYVYFHSIYFIPIYSHYPKYKYEIIFY